MTRILLLSLAGAIVFVGFAATFFLGGAGYSAGGVLIAIGSVVFLMVERRTKAILDADSAWNRTMKADGDSLLHRDGDQ